MRTYKQLNYLERAKIYQYLTQKYTIRAIASMIGRSPSTVSLEVRRNSDHIGYYYPTQAQAATDRRKARHGCKVARDPLLQTYVIEHLKLGWSPIAIAGRLSYENSQSITPEAIYAFIYSQPAKKLQLWTYLVRKKKKRGFTRATKHSLFIPHRTSIHERSEDINNRSQPGHFEADTMFHLGSMKSNVLTIVERKSRLAIFMKNETRYSESVIQKIADKIGHLAKSVTFDNGLEFAKHNILTQKFGIKTYFCDPGCPWQKGSVEHCNGMSRRFIPFKVPIHEITQEMLDSMALSLNHIPRKSLGFLTPCEVFKNDYKVNICGVLLHI